MVKTNNGLVWWQSAMAFLTFTASATVLANVVGDNVAAVYLMIVGGLQAATGAYVAGAKPVATEAVVTEAAAKP
jgi:hypothetical protein